MKTIFYAWQSQRPSKCNRTLIEEALKRALKELSQDEKAPVEFEIEQDARGALGAAEISSTILEKIDNCSAFIADVTPVGLLVDNKQTPNPNVLFELGYAWHRLGENRVILVLNETFGLPENLPFDISKRCLVRYRFDPETPDGPGNARNSLTNQFKNLITAMAHDIQVCQFNEYGLNDLDISLFKAIYARMLQDDSPICDFEAIFQIGQNIGLNEEGIIDAVQIIDDAGLWKATSVMGPHRYSHVQAVPFGMERYCERFLPGYNSIRDEITKRVVNGMHNSGEIAKTFVQPEILIEHILEQLDANDYISISKNSATIYVIEVKPKLRRLFESSDQ